MSIKRIILIFWALFFSLVFVTDLFDGLKAVGLLPDDWVFASTNFAFMLEVTEIYSTPTPVVALLFVGVIAWAGIAAAFFWRSALSFTGWNGPARRVHRIAFALGIGLWAAFLIADEFFLAYLSTDVSGVHIRLFVAQMVSLLVVALVPDEPAHAAAA